MKKSLEFAINQQIIAENLYLGTNLFQDSFDKLIV
jgi:hypothetical protein